MSTHTALVAGGAVLLFYLGAVLALVIAGRRSQARALAGFVPDCLVLFKRLMGEPLIPGRLKAVVAITVVYLASPIDLVPDFIPVAGQLDDAILVAVVLRSVVKAAGEGAVRRNWPGPGESLRVVLSLARSGGR